jgi:hypothetical protein
MNGDGVVSGIAGWRWRRCGLAAELVPENDANLRIGASATRAFELLRRDWRAEAGAGGGGLACTCGGHGAGGAKTGGQCHEQPTVPRPPLCQRGIDLVLSLTLCVHHFIPAATPRPAAQRSFAAHYSKYRTNLALSRN